MTQVTLNIPDQDLNFFMQLIEKFNYDTTISDFEMTSEIKNILDTRRKNSNEENYIPWSEVKSKIIFNKK
ncbi:hypothetical protein G6N05_01920 [Flavobacterium sp. F372]|jgi:hypothetical protein|uniref:Addiction module component n=1 Tax=Flavobacterium bernardetii TaxID=2813823 RepID=A0ABR7IV49_9FLAO|nr:MULTISPECIES: hypothetical protein [Flavobacterium]MBC5833632.1 hypothetical protein [Flavobacterium bernardetii]NHF68865.1 hypothetical protein [Flavobacterium bernardetii]